MGPNGMKLDVSGWGNGPNTAFQLQEGPDQDTVFLRACNTGLFVEVAVGEFIPSKQPVPLKVAHVGDDRLQTVAVDPTVLTQDDFAQFQREGYIIIRDAIPAEFIRDAKHTINYHLGRPESWDKDTTGQGQLKLQTTTCGQVGCDILNNSPGFWSALNLLLGEGNVREWRNGQQVALRFPQPLEKGHRVPDEKDGTKYHLDGMGEDQVCPFSLLAGVALSDQSEPNCGNLHVFPGSHLCKELHQYYQDKIADPDAGELDRSKPDQGESVQVLLRPGDVVIAHQLLAHRVGMNTSENIRYQLYYRVSHKHHQQMKGLIIDDPFVEFSPSVAHA